MKAIALISGGLDSILAARVIEEQGIEVIPLNFIIPFGHKARSSCVSIGQVEAMAKNLKQPLKRIDLAGDYLEIIKNPRYGFGSNMNPCIDCKILMLKKTKELLAVEKAEFVITGEVLGQRPMSQHRHALELIEKRSGLSGLLLRPLSAGVLEETIPEQKGWVDRKKLPGFSGRSRKPQRELAERLGIREYPNPAGGCLLTDPRYATRLKELIAHKELDLENVELLKTGRHFRLSPAAKLVVGRNEKENEELSRLCRADDLLFCPNEKLAGPTCLGRGKFDDGLIELACRITCRYCDSGSAAQDIIYKNSGQERVLKVAPLEEDGISGLRI